MNRGLVRENMIKGSTVHNQQIERLLVDVKRDANLRFQTIFFCLEDRGSLNPLIETYLLAQRYVFFQKINHAIIEFMADWYDHPLITEHNLFPN